MQKFSRDVWALIGVLDLLLMWIELHVRGKIHVDLVVVAACLIPVVLLDMWFSKDDKEDDWF